MSSYFCNFFVAKRGYKAPPKYWREVTMNDLPVPRGDFWELEAQRNGLYNKILATGVLVSGAALAIACSTDLIQLHYSPPKSID